jgi:hypothetical protein
MGDIALGREIQVFVAQETVFGTLVEPVAGDLILAIGEPTHGQERQIHEDEQKRNTRSRLAPIAGRYAPGKWGFPCYVKPSGAVGTAPPEDKLLEGLLGVKTITASTKVEYTPGGASVDLKSFSVWLKDGHSVFMLHGATVNEGRFRVPGNDLCRAEFSGECAKELWTGTDALTAAVDAITTTFPVNDGKRFSVNSVIQIENEICKVTAIATNNLTVSRGYKSTTAAAHASGVAVTPWLPTGTEAGAPVHGRLGSAQINAVNTNILDGEVTIRNGIVYNTEEKNGQDYADSFRVPAFREVTASLNLYFRKEHLARFKNAQDFDSHAIKLPGGTTAGSIFEIDLAQAKMKVPAISGAAERSLRVDLNPFATTAYNDEVKLTYR